MLLFPKHKFSLNKFGSYYPKMCVNQSIILGKVVECIFLSLIGIPRNRGAILEDNQKLVTHPLLSFSKFYLPERWIGGILETILRVGDGITW